MVIGHQLNTSPTCFAPTTNLHSHTIRIFTLNTDPPPHHLHHTQLGHTIDPKPCRAFRDVKVWCYTLEVWCYTFNGVGVCCTWITVVGSRYTRQQPGFRFVSSSNVPTNSNCSVILRNTQVPPKPCGLDSEFKPPV